VNLFIFLKQKDPGLWSMIILSPKTTRINNDLNKASAHNFIIYILKDSRNYVKQDLIQFFFEFLDFQKIKSPEL